MYIIAKRRGIVSKLLCLIKDTKSQTNMATIPAPIFSGSHDEDIDIFIGR